jgi:hypothetical protein
MSADKSEQPGPSNTEVEELEPGQALGRTESVVQTEGADAAARVEDLLAKVAASELPRPVAAPAPETPAMRADAARGFALRSGQPVALRGRRVTVCVRGVEGELGAELAPGVSPELVEQAVTTGNSVLLECADGAEPVVVGVLQTRLPEELVLRARRIELEADEEVVVRSGHGAMRIRQDGEVEIVGSRISALSRGLFRLVGRILRLN